MSAPLDSELRAKYSVSVSKPGGAGVIRLNAHQLCSAQTMLLQVRAVPVRKDDEVKVVRGSFKVQPCPVACRRALCALHKRPISHLQAPCRAGTERLCRCTERSG